MSDFNDLPAFDIRKVLKAIADERVKLAEAAGAAVAVELKMRFLAQISDAIRQEIPTVEAKLKKRKKTYLDCDLEVLDDAIDNVFGNDLNVNQRKELANFREKRNKLLHGDFVGLMKALGIEPGSRKIIGFLNGQHKRKPVEELNISEAIKSIKRQFGLDDVKKIAEGVSATLDGIIQSIAAKKD